jgi:hypothetical protein
MPTAATTNAKARRRSISKQRTAAPSTPLRQHPLTSADAKSPTDSAEEATMRIQLSSDFPMDFSSRTSGFCSMTFGHRRIRYWPVHCCGSACRFPKRLRRNGICGSIDRYRPIAGLAHTTGASNGWPTFKVYDGSTNGRSTSPWDTITSRGASRTRKVCFWHPATPWGFPCCVRSGLTARVRSCITIETRSIHPPPAPLGDGERINFLRALAIGERVGKAGPDLFRSPMKRMLSCAIFAMRKSWRARCAMP